MSARDRLLEGERTVDRLDPEPGGLASLGAHLRHLGGLEGLRLDRGTPRQQAQPDDGQNNKQTAQTQSGGLPNGSGGRFPEHGHSHRRGGLKFRTPTRHYVFYKFQKDLQTPHGNTQFAIRLNTSH